MGEGILDRVFGSQKMINPSTFDSSQHNSLNHQNLTNSYQNYINKGKGIAILTACILPSTTIFLLYHHYNNQVYHYNNQVKNSKSREESNNQLFQDNSSKEDALQNMKVPEEEKNNFVFRRDKIDGEVESQSVAEFIDFLFRRDKIDGEVESQSVAEFIDLNEEHNPKVIRKEGFLGDNNGNSNQKQLFLQNLSQDSKLIEKESNKELNSSNMDFGRSEDLNAKLKIEAFQYPTLGFGEKYQSDNDQCSANNSQLNDCGDII